MIVTLDQLVAAGHGDKQYQELFAEMSVSNSFITFFYYLVFICALCMFFHLLLSVSIDLN